MQRALRTCLTAAAVAALSLFSGCGGDSDAAVASPARPSNVLLLVTTTDSPPYSYRDATTGEIIGEEIDMAREAAAKLGCTLETRQEKFTELLAMVRSGAADMAASCITITEGRMQAVDFTIPYATEGGMFLYRAGEPMPTMILAEQMRIGTMDASTYDFYLTSHGLDPVRYDSYAMAMEDLRIGKLDAVFFDSCSVKLYAEGSGGAFAASRLETRENFGIAIRKGNTRLKDALNEVIAARRAK